jgi:hypothetical protein
VVGNQLVDRAGRTVRLLGANRSGTQYACAEGWGFFDGPTDDAAIAAMRGWGMNAVRVSLNESCWLGINGAPADYSGASHRAAIQGLVQRINARGMHVVLDLHWNAPGSQLAMGQQPMADRDHAPAFWRSVATTFKDNPSVVFDLYNEPYPDHNRNTTAAWTCVRDGGTCPGVPFTAAGSQEMLDAVRSTGATNVVMVGGPQYAGAVDRWMEFRPTDPLGQLAASVHVYGPDWAPCSTPSCWNGPLAALSRQVPVVVGELGTHEFCDSRFTDPFMDWADLNGISYLGWSWVVADCAAEPSLITSYTGTPTTYGAALRTRLQRLAGLRP